MEITRNNAKLPMKRRTDLKVDSKRWVTIFWCALLMLSSRSSRSFDAASCSCFNCLTVSNKSLFRCSQLLVSFLVRSVKMQIASLNLTNFCYSSFSELANFFVIICGIIYSLFYTMRLLWLLCLLHLWHTPWNTPFFQDHKHNLFLCTFLFQESADAFC